MTDDNNTVDMDDTNLDSFEAEFFGKADSSAETEDQVEETNDDVEENEEDSLANENEDEDENSEESSDEDSEDEDVEETDEDEEDEPEPKPKPKKRNRAQERIEQLLERERLATERANTLEKRLAALEAEKEVKNKPAPEKLADEAPQFDALDEDGNPVYDLGEFDPKYIRDLTKFTIEQETKAAKEKAEQERQLSEIQEARRQIESKWIENLDKAEDEIPEVRENIRTLADTFQGIDETYGDYLAMTIMNMDNGPQIMNYLSQNIGEAQKIVASGPQAATLALGRLDARLTRTEKQEEKGNTKKKVSKAPSPPDNRLRGRAGQFAVAPDTNDLNAFEKEFFKRA